MERKIKNFNKWFFAALIHFLLGEKKKREVDAVATGKCLHKAGNKQLTLKLAAAQVSTGHKKEYLTSYLLEMFFSSLEKLIN